MSVIVSLRQNGKPWIGCDSAVTSAHHAVGNISKWILQGRCALGAVGALGLLLEAREYAHRLMANPGPPAIDELANRLKALWKERGYEPRPATDQEPPWWDFQGIYVEDGGRVWRLDSSLQWVEQPAYWAEGGGSDYALGSLYATEDQPSPLDRLEMALHAACHFHVGCRPPLRIWRQTDTGWEEHL